LVLLARLYSCSLRHAKREPGIPGNTPKHTTTLPLHPPCACAFHEVRGGTVCGVGAEGFASFPCQTDRGLEE
jgi:hypothetical protein